MELRSGQTAVITGAGSGIGRALALALAERGLNVVVADIDAASARSTLAELEALGASGLAVPTDVADRESVEALASRSYSEFGRVDLLCNNAGVLLVRPLQACTQRDWDWLLGVNLGGVINGIQSFVPRLLAQGGSAHIVNSGSLCSLLALPGYGAYTTSKFAVAGLTESLRSELEPHGIGVSLLCPAAVRTRILESERVRPAALRPEGSESDPVPEETRSQIEAGLDPAALARRIMGGIRTNQAYILTHPETRSLLEERFDRVLAAFDRAAAAARSGAAERAARGSFGLAGRVAVVTGAGSGIGRGIALALARAGSHVVLADIELDAARKVAAEIEPLGVRVRARHVDVTQRDSVEELARSAYADLGAVHVLCNNAGVYLSGPLHDRTHADWDWVLGVNLHGVIHGLLAFLPRMLAQGGPARIVNTASIAGLMVSPRAGIYAASKQAVIGLSEALALDLAPHGIGVSVVCPGGVRTRIMASARNRPRELAATRPDEQTDRVAASAIEAGLEPEEVGRIVVDAIRREELHVLPQPGAKPFVEQRFRAILAALAEVRAG